MTWTIDPRRFGEAVKIDHRRLCVSAALEINKRLILATPVDTGRAQSNWMPSLGSPASGQREPMQPAEAMTIAQSTFSAAPPFPVLWLSNNLPYIRRLNQGHSKQAPAGFVETVIDGVVSAINGRQL